MEVGSLREETRTAEETACEKINASVVEQELETAILEYATWLSRRRASGFDRRSYF